MPAKVGHPVPDEGIPAGLQVDVDQRDPLQHPAGPVNDGEHVLDTLLGDWQGPWDGRHCRSSGLAGDLSPGTGLAVLHQLRHVLVHAGPHHSLRQWDQTRYCTAHGWGLGLKGTTLMERLESPAMLMEGQSHCTSAMAALSSTCALATTATKMHVDGCGGQDSVSATMLSCPDVTCDVTM